MKISCCWMYAIGMYGFPPPISDIKKVVPEMAAMGFRYIELEGMGYDNMRSVAAERSVVKRIIQDAGVQVVNFAPLLPHVTSLDPREQSKAMDFFRLGVETAAELGSPRVWVDSYAAPVKVIQGKTFSQDMSFGKPMYVSIPHGFSWPAFWDHFVQTIGRCNEIAREHGLEFLIEPRVHEVTSNSDALLRLFDAIPDRNLGAILDTAHQHAQKELLPLAIAKLADRIRYVHVADNDGRENRHLPPGDGTIDWDTVFVTLKHIGFDGFYAIDLESLPNLAEKFIASKKTLEDYGRKYDL